MEYFPLFIKLKNQRCLVVGAGDVATRKIDLLFKAHAKITVLAPKICDSIINMQHSHQLQLIKKEFESTDIQKFKLVVAATHDPEINEKVASAADLLNIPVNVVDNPELCSVVFPAIIDRSPVIAAISSGGASPVLARLLRARIETLIPAAYGRLAHLAEKYRAKVKQSISNPSQRRIFGKTPYKGQLLNLFLLAEMKRQSSNYKTPLAT